MGRRAAESAKLDVIAAEFPERHIWRGRDQHGQLRGWYATLRRHPDRDERRRGLLMTLCADDPDGLSRLLAQQRSLASERAGAGRQ